MAHLAIEAPLSGWRHLGQRPLDDCLNDSSLRVGIVLGAGPILLREISLGPGVQRSIVRVLAKPVSKYEVSSDL
jgi:hypothetical protein